MQKAREILYMIKNHMPGVIAIENANEELPWDRDQLVSMLGKRNMIGMTSVYGDEILGFAVYEMHAKKIEVLKFSVDPVRTREGIGSQMIAKLKSKLSEQRRNSLQFLIPETNDAGMLFLRANGFKGSLVRDGFPELGRDGIRFEYTLACPVGLPDRLMNAV